MTHDETSFNAVDPRTHPGVDLRPDAVIGRLGTGSLVVTVGQASADPQQASVKIWSEGPELDLVRLELGPDDALALAELLLRAARSR